MPLTSNNYFSIENNMKYLSVSQIKSFIGAPAIYPCEESALKELKGEYKRSKSDALLVGSYVDIALTGTKEEMIEFINDHPEMFVTRGERKGELKATFAKAEKMIERVKKDAESGGIFARTLYGEHQKIFTGDLYGYPVKIKIDNLGKNFITDLKTAESITKIYFSVGKKYNFISFWNYELQAAIYQKVYEQNTGKRLPFYISAVSKEAVPDIGVFQIPQDAIDEALSNLPKELVERIVMIKNGEIEPERCEQCDYCKDTKVIKAPIDYRDIWGEV